MTIMNPALLPFLPVTVKRMAWLPAVSVLLARLHADLLRGGRGVLIAGRPLVHAVDARLDDASVEVGLVENLHVVGAGGDIRQREFDPRARRGRSAELHVLAAAGARLGGDLAAGRRRRPRQGLGLESDAGAAAATGRRQSDI